MNGIRKWTHLGALAVCGAAVIVAGCSTIGGSVISGISVSKSKPFIVSADSKMGWGHNAFGILQEYEDDLIAVHYTTEGDNSTGPFITVDEDGNYLPGHRLGRGPAVSSDRGKTWRVARPVLPGLSRPSLSPAYRRHLNVEHPAFFHSMMHFPDGRRIVFHPVLFPSGDSPNHTAVGCAIRRDAEGRWHPAEDVFFEIRGPEGEPPDFSFNKAPRGVVMPDGSLVTVAYSRWKGKYNRRSIGYVTIAFRSTDGGRTFEQLSIVATEDDAPWGNDGPCEPGIALMPDGDLLCVMRTGDTRTQGAYDRGYPLLAARSKDGGKTWKLSKLPMGGVMPKLLVMRDGTVVLATGRPGNTLFFSRNAGRSWQRELAISRANVKTSGYIDVLEVAPGRLLVTYDQFDSPIESFWLWEPTYVNGILGAFVDVRSR
jgi:hypothetical protein